MQHIDEIHGKSREKQSTKMVKTKTPKLTKLSKPTMIRWAPELGEPQEEATRVISADYPAILGDHQIDVNLRFSFEGSIGFEPLTIKSSN